MLALAVVAVFGRAVSFEFVNWDDNENLYNNPYFNPPTWASLRFFWTHSYKQFFLPVTYTVWWVLARGAALSVPDEEGGWLNPQLFHLVNVIVHAVNVALVWRIVRRVVPHDLCAAAGALAWGLHPLRAEPVAWVTGLKDVLSGFFAFLAILQYQEAMQDDSPRARRGRLAFSTAAYVLAVLSKPTMIAALPVAVVLSVWEDRRRWRAALLGASVWSAFALPVAALAIYLSWTTGARFTYPVWQRPLVAGDTAAFYVWKTLVPWPLAIAYDRSPAAIVARGAIYWTWVVPAALLSLAFAARRRAPWVTASILIALLGMAPASGLIPFGFQILSTAADRYTYLPSLGLATAVAAALASATRHPTWRRPAWTAAAVVLMTWAAMCYAQVGDWKDSVTLSSQMVKVNRQPFPRLMHAGNLVNHRKFDEAESTLRGILADQPESLQARIALSELLATRGRQAEAVAEARAAAAVYFRHPERLPQLSLTQRARLGASLQRAGQLDKVADIVAPALRRAPRDVDDRVSLAMLLLGGGRVAECERLLGEADAVGTNPELVADARVVVGRTENRGIRSYSD